MKVSEKRTLYVLRSKTQTTVQVDPAETVTVMAGFTVMVPPVTAFLPIGTVKLVVTIWSFR
jgi:hypothetical protein